MDDQRNRRNGVDPVPRSEFEAFERSVNTAFSTVRDDIHAISRKIDSLAGRGTDWKAIFAGISVFATFAFGIGSVIAWGILQRMDSISERVERHEAIDGHPKAMQLHQGTALQLEAHAHRLTELNSILRTEMRTLDAHQDELGRERIGGLRTRLDRIDPALDRIELRLDEIEQTRFRATDGDALEARMSHVERVLDVVRGRTGEQGGDAPR